MDQNQIIEFLKESKALSFHTLEQEAGLSQGLLSKAVSNQRNLNESHIEKLIPVLQQYGFKPGDKTAKVITILNHKGGVGKTTTALNLGKALSLEGKKVLLIDLDPQCNLTQWLNILSEEHTIYDSLIGSEPLAIQSITDTLDAVSSNLSLAQAETELHQKINGYYRLQRKVIEVAGSYDFVLVDCPPSLNILTANALLASDSVLIIMQPEKLPMNGLGAIIDAVNQVNDESDKFLDIEGLLFTQVKKQLVNHQETIDQVGEICASNQIRIFDTMIRSNTSLSECVWLHQDIFDYDSQCIGAVDYRNLAKEIIG
jgi:chromosome partitioning protein